jgi:hydroxymethylbilane synthase
MEKKIRIGTRDSQLAIWQATRVMEMITAQGYSTSLVFIKSEGDIDLHTPLYEMGVQGVFTRSLDTALLSQKIDIAVHSMKDVPVVPARGIAQAAVLTRASHLDLLVHKGDTAFLEQPTFPAVIATSSIRRKAQWLNRYPSHQVENLRGNVNTRLKKLKENNWQGAIFAAAGLERIRLRPSDSIELDWMLPAPAQGAIMVVAREDDNFVLDACASLNDEESALCTKLERDFLKAFLGGCSTPISAHAKVGNGMICFTGNVLSTDGRHKKEITLQKEISQASTLGREAASTLLENGGKQILEGFHHAVS